MTTEPIAETAHERTRQSVSNRWWPAWALAAVLLIESRLLTSTPELAAAAKKHPTPAAVAAIHDERIGAIIGTSLTWLGLACLVVFALSLAQAARSSRTSLAPNLILVGGAITAGVLMLSFAVLYELGVALGERYAVTSIAALDTLGEAGYDGWVAMGLLTAGVALAALRDGTLPRWLGWLSVPATGLFALLVFAPFFAWAPGLLWLLVTGVGLLIRPVERLAVAES